MRRTFAAAAILLSFAIPSMAAEPAMEGRFGPGRHFLDSGGAQKAARKVVSRKGHKVARKGKTHREASKARSERSASSGRSVSLEGVTPVLASKAQEIMAACGSVVTSARNARGYRSNHPIGRAVDMQGNPACMKSHLMNWPGGLSTDYWNAPGGPHYHISYNPGGQEWGLRFAHRNPFLGRRYARYVPR